MIVVIGSPLHLPGTDDQPSAAGGLAVRIAATAVAAGADVQLVGSVGEDPAGDATLIALAGAGIGHAATRRDPARPTPALLPDDPSDDPEAETLAEPGPSAAETATSLGPFGSAALDGADLELALRYLEASRVVVVAERLGPGGLDAVVEAADYGGAATILIVAAGSALPDRIPVSATVLAAPDADPDGVFARTVGTFAAALDRGSDPGAALHQATAAVGWGPGEA